jgi:hypothetical protein
VIPMGGGDVYQLIPQLIAALEAAKDGAEG